MAHALVSIGSNLGNRQQHVGQAVERIGRIESVKILATSSWHETAPIGGPTGQPPFLNGAVLLETALDPEQLWQALSRIESDLGRRRDVRWDARSIDLDLLLYDELQISTPQLTVPHPRMTFRRFVLEPAVAVAPTMVHPPGGWTLAEHLRHLDSAVDYLAITSAPGIDKSWLKEKIAQEFQGATIECPQFDAIDSPGPATVTPIELLTAGAKVLGKHSWPADRKLRASSFWFDQALAYGRLKLDDREFSDLQSRHRVLIDQIVQPKLLVLLTGVAQVSGDSQAVQIEQAIIELVQRPGIGPVLRLNATDHELVWEETRAAIGAMRK